MTKRLSRTVRSVVLMALLGGIASLVLAAPLLAAPKEPAPKYICHSRYAGPCFEGQPALNLAASLVAAGGGPAHYSTARALTSLAGAKVATAEVAKLTKQYGPARVASWQKVFDFVVVDAVRVATKAGLKLPSASVKGKALATALVANGVDANTFYIELLLDKIVSHRIHESVMDDIDTHFGPTADAYYHRISNQAMYDLAHALGAKQVKLCVFH